MNAIVNSVLSYIWLLITTWFWLFFAPLRNFEMLWIIIPIYCHWVFAEFFQEKRGTSLGNAISNAIVVLWASIDWARQSVGFYNDGVFGAGGLALKLFIVTIVIAYAAWIVYDGINGKKLTHYIGKIRVVSYIILMLTPLMYNVVELTFTMILSIVIFFPLFYYVVGLIDKFTPDPESIKEEEKGGLIDNEDSGSDSFSSSSSDDSFGSSSGGSDSFGGGDDFGKF